MAAMNIFPCCYLITSPLLSSRWKPQMDTRWRWTSVSRLGGCCSTALRCRSCCAPLRMRDFRLTPACGPTCARSHWRPPLLLLLLLLMVQRHSCHSLSSFQGKFPPRNVHVHQFKASPDILNQLTRVWCLESGVYFFSFVLKVNPGLSSHSPCLTVKKFNYITFFFCNIKPSTTQDTLHGQKYVNPCLIITPMCESEELKMKQIAQNEQTSPSIL